MLTTGIILIIVSILLVIYSYYSLKNTHKINESVDKRNEELKEEYDEIKGKVLVAQKELIDTRNHLDDIQSTLSKTVDSQKELSQKALQNYYEILETQYEKEESNYNNKIEKLQLQYEELAQELDREYEESKNALDKIKATRAAAIQAQLKEKEIEDNKDYFRLDITDSALKDIRLLKSIQSEITNAIVIDKIIWSNYYQPLAKTKFPKIIGKTTTCGIYKITSLISGQCYIGQSVDCCDRWKQHCKNALGVGNVSGESKLYKAMKKDGLSNFTFEILEECESKNLDEKEKYYIDLYDSYHFGLNGNKGNG